MSTESSVSPQSSGGTKGGKIPSDPQVAALQIMVATTAFPGVAPGTIIKNPTPEQLAAANEVRSCIHFIYREE